MQSDKRPPISVRAVIVFLIFTSLVASVVAIYYYNVSLQLREEVEELQVQLER